VKRSGLLLVILAALTGAFTTSASATGSHLNPCHLLRSCPSDNHSYVWHDLVCTSHSWERYDVDTKTVVYGGHTYWCHPNAVVTPPADTPTVTGALGVRTKTSGCHYGVSQGFAVLPDLACSPGAADPLVTADNLQQTVCVSGYTKTVRNVSQATKNAVYAEYGIATHAPYSYEVDHIVSLELGGSNSIANLYPEAYAGTYGARKKDVIENSLHQQICAGTMTLSDAQHTIAGDWLSYYLTHH
jgi:hypothetical protein